MNESKGIIYKYFMKFEVLYKRRNMIPQEDFDKEIEELIRQWLSSMLTYAGQYSSVQQERILGGFQNWGAKAIGKMSSLPNFYESDKEQLATALETFIGGFRNDQG